MEAICKYDIKLKWGGCPAPMETVSNPCEQENSPRPITSTADLRSRIQKTQKKPTYTDGTKETVTLQRQLQRDLKETSQLHHLLQTIQASTHHTKSKRQKHRRHRPRKKNKHHYSSSSADSTSEKSSSETDSDN